jgi:hypothetical protein
MHFEPIPAYRFLTDPKIPLGSRRFRAAFGGRGSAKSWEFTNAALFHTMAIPKLRVAFLREVQATLKESSLELVRSRLDHYGLLSNGYFREVDGSFEGKHGQKIMFMGLWKGGKPEGIKSLEGVNLTVVEEATEITQKSIDILIPTIMRTPVSEMWAIWNPRLKTDAIDEFFRGKIRPPKSICVKINHSDNPYFPAGMAEVMATDYQKGPKRASWIWDGEYMPSIDGSLWPDELLTGVRGEIDINKCRRIVIGVDPSGSMSGKGDLVGIVVAGQYPDDRYCVIADLSMPSNSPDAWARTVCGAYERFKADSVICETNFGGNLVVDLLRRTNPRVRVKTIHASRGKHVRAAPIAALYEQARVCHNGRMTELEGEMAMMAESGYCGSGSPDRLDAMVWALTELSEGTARPDQSAKVVERRAGDYRPKQVAEVGDWKTL